MPGQGSSCTLHGCDARGLQQLFTHRYCTVLYSTVQYSTVQSKQLLWCATPVWLQRKFGSSEGSKLQVSEAACSGQSHTLVTDLYGRA